LKSSTYKKIIWGTVTVFLTFWLIFVIPIPNLFCESPGGLFDCRSMVNVNGKKDTKKGAFYVTSVLMKKMTVADFVEAKFFSDFIEIRKKEQVLGNSSYKDYVEMQNVYMDSAKNIAIYQASKLAGIPSDLQFEGVYVMNVVNYSDFAGKINVGDTIEQIDGESFQKLEDLLSFVKKQKVGQKITVGFTHEGRRRKATGKLIKLKQTQSVGIGISLADKTVSSNRGKIDIESGDLGGPSGGLMLTLESYQILSGKNLRHGKKIAGTGTIEKDGTVGRIGGIDKKIVSASEAGAKIFLAPAGVISAEEKKFDPKALSNYEEAVKTAKKIQTKMKIIPVKTVEDALNYLNNIH